MFVVLAIDRTIAGLRAAQCGRHLPMTAEMVVERPANGFSWTLPRERVAQPEREAPVSHAPVL
jgi:hypothetical protein